MTSATRAIAAVLNLSVLSGCAATGASLDRFADQAEARSSCHTSTGELVAAPSCTVSYTVSSSTTTTTTTTTTTAPAKADD
ncbi:hypothetical protein [Brevundimonas sp. Root1423]|uniref:hypothetical protein n=1 Tax=Brevundimonas sp. Root1423 TaxID=1736462 RepID=UPI0006F1E13F|nr:hypothetical protein [Brevundimonas sp. Root1423]KQY84719.1 hypothetical protein ASD25_06735 [Brevundimonas sp. Root1423]